MFRILPAVVESNAVAVWSALSCATPWSIELLTTTWGFGEEAHAQEFYTRFFGGFGAGADEVC
jgi:hypothetical protein